MHPIEKNIFDNPIESHFGKIVQKYGRGTLVLMITAISILLSLLVTYLFVSNTRGVDLSSSMAIAVMVPSIVAPITSWFLIGQTEQIKTMEQAMRDLATYDSQTGLLTRQAFYHDAQSYLNILERNPDYYSVMMLDIDHFKKVNDTYGHQMGDRVLEHVGTFFSEHLRNSDIAGRLGGEEFAVLLPHTSPDDAFGLAETIRTNLAKKIIAEKSVSLSVTVSIGIAHYTQETTSTIQQILKDADIALYRAKQSGRNRTELFVQEASAT